MANEEVVFQKGETVPCYCDSYLMSSGAEVDPTTITIDIYNPSGTKIVDGQAMTKLDTGNYVYYHNTDSDSPIGWYGVEVAGVDGVGGGAKTTIKKGGFKLE